MAPLNAADREPVASQEDLSVKDLARCVVNSLAQPFGAEIVVLPGRWPAD